MFAFGTATFKGTLLHDLSDAHVVGILTTPAGDGYRLITNVGHVHAFGAATYLGSPRRASLHGPIVAGA